MTQIIEERFQNSSPPVEAVSEKGFVESILSELSAISEAIKIIAWVTLLATLLVVGNTMAMSIRERSTEQGVLRTLGFSKWAIFRLYLSESMALSFFGALLGAISACLLFTFIPMAIPGGQGRPGLAIGPYWSLLKTVVLLALLMGILSGFPPAFFSMRRKITDTLRFLA
ncbi:MAG: FtsX-like permease family protein [Deltaproteobacteria bacterium]|nr:FtsX-like permease family protein [Deltaproteobacteria bacterium]